MSLYRLAVGQAHLVWRGGLTNGNDVLNLPQLQSKIRDGKYDSMHL